MVREKENYVRRNINALLIKSKIEENRRKYENFVDIYIVGGKKKLEGYKK